MKTLNKYILAVGVLAFLAPVFSLRAEEISQGGVHLAKKVEKKAGTDDTYTLTLESYVTGTNRKTYPANIVLVLDVSGSMDDQLKTPVSLGRKSLSYNSLGTNDYYIYLNGRYTIKDEYYGYEFDYGLNMSGYCPVHGYKEGNNYYLYFIYDGTRYWIGNNGNFYSYNNKPTGYAADKNVYSGTIYTGSRMASLKQSVKDFIDIIAENDSKLSEDVGHNQISIVKFAGPKSNSIGNDRYESYESNHYEFNYSQTVIGFQDVYLIEGEDGPGVTALKKAVDALVPGGATRSDYGMQLASGLFTDDIDEHNKKTVVMFTDGTPGETGWSGTVATNAVNAAKGMKDAGITVFTVGVFGGDPGTNVTNYMNRVSSNYPNATTYQNGTRGEGDYYYTASNEDEMREAFKEIAAQSGADIPLDDKAEIRDEVTQSFNVVNDASAVRVYLVKNNGNANGIVWATTNTPKPDNVILTWTQGNPKINVTGFNYMDNWVGYDYEANQPHGYKLVIEIDIKIDDDAVGGKQVNTNTGDSGIYYKDENGVEQSIGFPIPHLSIPITIQIKKHGLRNGESASFSIYRVLDDVTKDKDYYSDKSVYPPEPYMVVNVTGTTSEWVLKAIRTLDPNYVYMIWENDWSWAYQEQDENGQITTRGQLVNPFDIYNNPEDPDIKHAEAKVTNDFKTNKVTVTPAKGK